MEVAERERERERARALLTWLALLVLGELRLAINLLIVELGAFNVTT